MGKKKKRKQRFEPEVVKYDITKYAEYIKEHAKEIGEKVNHEMRESIDSIREDLVDTIKAYLEFSPIHYEWQPDGCPYDSSGKIVEKGTVSLDQTVKEFLSNEYTGRTTATFTSGHGLSYDAFGYELSYYTFELAEDFMYNVTKNELELVFPQEINDDMFNEIINYCHDDIFDNCLAIDFFCWEPAIDFVGIGDIKLSELMVDTENGSSPNLVGDRYSYHRFQGGIVVVKQRYVKGAVLHFVETLDILLLHNYWVPKESMNIVATPLL